MGNPRYLGIVNGETVKNAAPDPRIRVVKIRLPKVAYAHPHE